MLYVSLWILKSFLSWQSEKYHFLPHTRDYQGTEYNLEGTDAVLANVVAVTSVIALGFLINKFSPLLVGYVLLEEFKQLVL